MSVLMILVVVAGGLAIFSMFPAGEKWPMLSVSCLLLALAMLVMTGGH